FLLESRPISVPRGRSLRRVASDRRAARCRGPSSRGRGQGGRVVARKRRIRHKLMLGFGLIVGIMSLVLAGALKGLLSYSMTVKSIESKLAEYKESRGLMQAVGDLWNEVQSDRSAFEALEPLGKKVQQLRTAKAAYEERLRDTLARGRDPKNGS